MPENFYQYYLIETLSKKYSHATYLASPTNEPERHVILTTFARSLFHFPHEHEKLLQKVQRIKQLQHPHLLPILDMRMNEEQPFIVREYLSNGSLRSRLKQISPERMELRDALTIILQVGEALAYAYEHNISHGNVRPENILFDANGRAALTDFSLVERKDAIIRDQTSQEYAFCYLAPEQFAGISDAKSDQYALGCLAYELITGSVPFAAQSLASMMGQQNNALPALLSEHVTGLLPSLEIAILKALVKEPAERFFDFSLFLEVVQSALLPSPAFPFAPSPRNRAISHPVQSAEAGDTSSFPISNHTTPSDSGSQLQEASEDFAGPEVDAAEPMDTFSISQISMPEWSGILPVSESLESVLQSDQFSFPLPGEVYPIGDREHEEETDDLETTDTFVQEKADTAADKTLFVAKSSNNGGSHFVQPLRNRGRILRFMVLLSVIMAVTVIASAFWTARTSAPDTRSPSTKKMIQVVPLTKATDILTVQPSVQATNVPTAQATDAPTVQSSIQATNIPIAQPSSSTPAPIITPTPSPPISYEAEATQNTMANGARVVGCGTGAGACSNGSRVGYIGLNSGAAGTLQFNDVGKTIGGRYTLTVYYMIAGSDTLVIYVSVNGGSAVTLNIAQTPTFTLETTSITISLNAGHNTIEFSNPSNPAPDIDRIVV
jgi:serine/threonine protein kinase